MMIRARIDAQPEWRERKNIATVIIESDDHRTWRVRFLDHSGGRWSTTLRGRYPTPWHVVKAAFDRLPDMEECAVCGRTYRRLLRDGVCGGCRAMLEARR